MTTIYKPVRIESAEQAEALPVGTLILRRGDSGPWQKVANRHMGDHYRGDGAVIGDPGIVGSQALVPIEAEEEHQNPGGTSVLHGTTSTWPARTRLVTPWEESR